MTERPILFSFRRCPYAIRARLALAISDQAVTLREVVLRDKPAELLTASPKATVPVLVLPGGQVIDESLEIMHWALGQNDPEGWLLMEDRELIAENDGPFKAALDRYKYPHRFKLESGSAYRDAGLRWLEKLELRLTQCAFLAGEKAGITDFALLPFVRQFAATDEAWFAAQTIPRTQLWLSNFLSSALFYTIMVRYPKWTADQEPISFP